MENPDWYRTRRGKRGGKRGNKWRRERERKGDGWIKWERVKRGSTSTEFSNFVLNHFSNQPYYVSFLILTFLSSGSRTEKRVASGDKGREREGKVGDRAEE